MVAEGHLEVLAVEDHQEEEVEDQPHFKCINNIQNEKNIFFLLVALGFSTQSQEIKDALRYSQDNITGTARFRAMSGAFGALGGDLLLSV
jgi:hypothetical protein